MINYSLLNILEEFLGKGKETSKHNFAFTCPFCKEERAKLGKTNKPKLEIQLITNAQGKNKYNCWFCKTRGTTIKSLLTKLKVPEHRIEELIKVIHPTSYQEVKSFISLLPQEFKPLSEFSTNIFYRKAINYLKNRGITKYDILRYNIGYCLEGEFADRIIIPSYGENGDLNFFIARSFNNSTYESYKNPKASRDIIFNEFFINWNQPIILCEGVFDALAIKRNAIPLLGKDVLDSLMKKLVTSKIKKIYIALDKDAMKVTLEYIEYLMSKNKEVYLVELEEKDPSKLGFEKFNNLVQTVQPLTFQNLLLKKMEI